VEAHGQVHEHRRAHRHQRVGAQAGGALAQLPLQADRRAEHEGRAQADQGADRGPGVERRQVRVEVHYCHP